MKAKSDKRKEIKQKRPIVTVGAAIFRADGKMLFTKSHKWSNKWSIPGGKIDLGETSTEALHREILEETKLSISDVEFIGMTDSIYEPEFYKRVHMLLLNYRCMTTDVEIVLNNEAEEFQWEFPESAIEMNLNRPTIWLVNQLISNG